METIFHILPFILIAAAVLFFATVPAMAFRCVVPTNMVHIVQVSKDRRVYGKIDDKLSKWGNTYWKWPSWIPIIGVSVSAVPTSIFEVSLNDYSAYDSDRLPLRVDVQALLRVVDPLLIAERVSGPDQLSHQVKAVIQGCVRSTIATDHIESIMGARDSLNKVFSDSVAAQLGEWGLTLSKELQFMEIKDAEGSHIIRNIMDKQRSRIESESRIAIAQRNQEASVAETSSAKAISLNKEQAEQEVGIRAAQRQREVGLAAQQSQQQVLEATRATTTSEMEVRQIAETRAAEIARSVAEVQARQNQQVEQIAAETRATVAKTNAEAAAAVTETNAQAQARAIAAQAAGQRDAAKLEAEGIAATGTARAEAEKAMLMAPVAAQVELATTIGSNEGYQEFLLKKEQIAANMQVGLEQARALANAELKIIANSSDVQAGMNGFGKVLGADSGFNFSAAMANAAATEEGSALLASLGKFLEKPRTVVTPA